MIEGGSLLKSVIGVTSMTTRSLAAVACCIVSIPLAGFFAWRCWSLSADLAIQKRTIGELEVRLEAAEQRFVTQRELQRQDRLTNAARTPDEFLALFPAKFPEGNWQPAEVQFEDCWFRSADGLRLHGWLIRHPQPRAAVLFIHGNAGNLTHRSERASQLNQRYQVSVLVFDYRGYGRSEGTPTIDGILHDAHDARALLAEREGIVEDEVVLLGESLGGAVAVDLAARDGARGLILESTFSSLKEAAAAHYPAILVDTLVADRLNSVANIGRYGGPLLQVHGDADRTIPLALGQMLHAAARGPKQLLVVPGHDHNDSLPEEYFALLDEFFRGLPQH